MESSAANEEGEGGYLRVLAGWILARFLDLASCMLALNLVDGGSLFQGLRRPGVIGGRDGSAVEGAQKQQAWAGGRRHLTSPSLPAPQRRACKPNSAASSPLAS